MVGLSGSLGTDFHKVHEHGIDAAFAITNAPMTLEQASANAAALITSATEEIMRTLKAGGRVFS